MCECKKRKLEEEEKDRKDRLVAQIQEEMGTLTRHTFETFRDHTEDMRDAREVCQYYARNAHLESTWLVLFGDPGLGKTHLAAATTNQCVQQGIPSRFLSVPQMITYIKQGIRADRGAMSVEDRLIELSKVRLLVLDDLGAHSPTAWANDRLFEVLQARYQDRLPTVITSNFPVAKSLAYDGQDERQAMQVKRMVSRFKEMAIVIKFIGEDYRGVASTEPRQ
jgi:DNA replication protein DnaC